MRAEMGGEKKYSPPRETTKSKKIAISFFDRVVVGMTHLR